MKLRPNSITSTLTLFVCTALLLLAAREAGATNYTTLANGNWTDVTKWDSGDGTPGDDAYPGTGDTITWGGAHKMNIIGANIFSGGIMNQAIGSAGPFPFGGGETVTLDSGTFLLYSTGTTVFNSAADGRFIISAGATVIHSNVAGTVYIDNPIFENSGTYRYVKGPIQLRGAGSIVNKGLFEVPDADVAITTSGSGFSNSVNATLLVDGANFDLSVPFYDGGGRVVATNGGVILLTNGDADDVRTDPNTSLESYGSSEIRLGGDILELQGSIVGDGNVGFGHENLYCQNGGFVDFGDDTVYWYGQGVANMLKISAGQTLEFRSDLVFDGSTGYGMKDSAASTWKINSGVSMTISNNGPLYLEGGTLENDGTVVCHNNGRFYLRGGTFQNDGTYRWLSGSTAWSRTGGDFENYGTVEAGSGATLDIPSSVPGTQWFSGNSLIDGTWEVSGTLDLNRGANITTIGAGATVRMEGSGGTFTEFTGNLTDINGTFSLHEQHIYDATGDSLTIPGTIELGLEDSDASATKIINGISNAVNVTLTGGEVDVVDLGITVPGTFTFLTWSGTRTGTLTISNVPSNGLEYDLSFNDSTKIYQLEVTAGPIGPPIINTIEATNVTDGAGYMNGLLISTGGTQTAVWVFYGPSDGTTNFTGGWDSSAQVSPNVATGSVTHLASSLGNTVFHYRYMASNSTARAFAASSEAFLPDPVTVTASNAFEAGITPGTFTVHRVSTATNGAVTINYTISGTAVAGTDYVNDLGTSVIIAENDETATVVVTPIQNFLETNDVVVTLTLAAGPFAIGSPGSADLTIVNEPKLPNPFVTRATGNWTADTGAGGTWDPDGTLTHYPQGNDTASWGGAHTVTVNSPEDFSGGTAAFARNPFLSLTSTLTLNSGGTFTLDPPGTMLMGGSAAGRFIVSSGATLLHMANNASMFNNTASVENNGTTRFTGGGDWNFQSGRFINNGLLEATTSGGQISDGGTLTNSATGTIQANGATFDIDLDFFDGGGSIVATNGGVVEWNINSQPVTTDPYTTFTAYDTGEIKLGGNIVALQGTISGDVFFGADTVGQGNLVACTSGGFIDFANEVTWKASGQNILSVSAGQTLELRSDMQMDTSVGYMMKGAASGIFKINSGVTFTTSGANQFYIEGGTVENDGTIDATAPSRFQFRVAGAKFQNDGTYRVSSGAMTWTVSAAGIFENAGTVEVASGATLTISSTLDGTQFFSGNTLIAGTWDVTGTLNLDEANAGIDIIGASASVILGGVSANFAELSSLATVTGELRLEDDAKFTTTGNISTPGTLTFALDGADLGTELLDVQGDPTFTSGTVDVVDLGGMIAGTYVLISWTGNDGGTTLTLGTTPANGFTYQLQKNGMTYELVVGSGFVPATIMRFF